MRDEYGGCLFFEVGKPKKDYYDKYREHRIDVDSGRSALQYIVENYGFRRIWLPIYNCPLVGQRIREISTIDIVWYNLKQDFYPDIEFDRFKTGDCLLWVNYWGIMPEATIDEIVTWQEKVPGLKIIIDNIPAYFTEPRMDAINIYSCRKFIGVPDGGHIIGNDVEPTQLPTYSTSENYMYLLKAIETGSNSAYEGYNVSEKRFREAKIAYGMPVLTKRVLAGIDYDYVIKKRKDNFMILHERLKDSNRLPLSVETDAPSVYPYLCSNIHLRDRLLESKIYVSRFWKHILTNKLANELEKDFAELLIPLPIDQRYEVDDMNNIADKVREYEV